MNIPNGYFNEGEFLLDVYVIKNKNSAICVLENIIGFTIVPEEIDLGVYSGIEKGYSRQEMQWEEGK